VAPYFPSIPHSYASGAASAAIALKIEVRHSSYYDGAPFKKSDRSEEGCLEHAMSQRASFQVPDTSALKTQTWRKMG
jgi:hypothetical protein